MQETIKINKTINLSRAIVFLTRNGTQKEERTLVGKIELASLELVDVAHNKNDTYVVKQINYINDLFKLAKDISLFQDDNIIFVLNAIKNTLEMYKTDSLNRNITSHMSNILSQGPIDNRNKEIDILLETKKETNKIKTNYVTYETQNKKSTEVKKFPTFKKDISEDMRDTYKIKESNAEDILTLNNRKLSRREEVLKTLSSVPISIKEVAGKVLGCSEKTLQRELNSLVDDRAARRIGEKRWSRYVLA